MKPDCLCSLDGVADPILVTNGIDTQLDAWANLRGWPIDPCAASIVFWFTSVPHTTVSVDDLVCLPFQRLHSQKVIGQRCIILQSQTILGIKEITSTVPRGIEW